MKAAIPALLLMLSLSPGSWATRIDLGRIGLGDVHDSGEIEPKDYIGRDLYTELNFEEEDRFYFDVFDFTVTRNMLLTVTVGVDPTSDLYPYIYLFRPDNAPDLADPVWLKYNDTVTEIDFYVERTNANPNGPLITSGEGYLAVLDENVFFSEPAFRLIITGEYIGNQPGIGEAGAYSVTISGTSNRNTIVEPGTESLLALGLLGVIFIRRRSRPGPLTTT